MGEVKNTIETLSKMKILGYIFAVAGVAFFFTGIADLSYYLSNLDGYYLSEPLVTTALFVIKDVLCLATAVALWVFSAKSLRAKN